MPTIKDLAFCIRHWDFSETSQTVGLFTREHGVIRGLAKGARRERGSFSGGIDLLTAGHVVAIVKPGRELSTLTHWHLEQTYPVLRHDLQANRTAWYMADLIYQMLRDHDPAPAVFDALGRALERMGGGASGHRLLEFQWILLRETGYQPQLDQDAETTQALDEGEPTLAFSAAAGGVVADTGAADRWRVRTETIQAIRRVAGEGVAEGPEAVIERANRLLAAYIREIIGADLPTIRWRFPGL